VAKGQFAADKPQRPAARTRTLSDIKIANWYEMSTKAF